MCVNPPPCADIDIGGTPLHEELTGRNTPTVISVALLDGQPAALDAAGFAEGVSGLAVQALAGVLSKDGEPPLGSGVQVTKLVRRKLKAGSGFRTTFRLRLNAEGKKLLQSEGTLRVLVVVQITGSGDPITLHFTRVWRPNLS